MSEILESSETTVSETPSTNGVHGQVSGKLYSVVETLLAAQRDCEKFDRGMDLPRACVFVKLLK